MFYKQRSGSLGATVCEDFKTIKDINVSNNAKQSHYMCRWMLLNQRH